MKILCRASKIVKCIPQDFHFRCSAAKIFDPWSVAAKKVGPRRNKFQFAPSTCVWVCFISFVTGIPLLARKPLWQLKFLTWIIELDNNTSFFRSLSKQLMMNSTHQVYESLAWYFAFEKPSIKHQVEEWSPTFLITWNSGHSLSCFDPVKCYTLPSISTDKDIFLC